MNAVIVTYQVKPDQAAANAEAIRAVYAELADKQPPGFSYATFVDADGVTFRHIGLMADGSDAPLPQLEAFRSFRQALDDRVETAIVQTPLGTNVGSYGL